FVFGNIKSCNRPIAVLTLFKTRSRPGEWPNKMGIVALDIFCGAGGVTYGLCKAGIRVLTGVDIKEECRLTFTQNNPSVRFLANDVRQLSVAQLFAHIDSIDRKDFLLLAACAPCQPFSSQNRYREKANGRAILGNVERLLRELRPDFLFLEN